MQAVGEDIRAEFNKEEELAKLQANLLEGKDEETKVNESKEQELEMIDTMENDDEELNEPIEEEPEDGVEVDFVRAEELVGSKSEVNDEIEGTKMEGSEQGEENKEN